MAGIETYGGSCPKCSHGMQQKFESAFSGFMFDACPWCGFIYATDVEHHLNDFVWKEILNHFDVSTKEEMIAKYELPPFTPDENKEFYPSIFSHVDEEDTLLIYKLLWKQYANNQVENFTIKGLRVYWEEDKTKQGTITDYKKGLLHILWDGEIKDAPDSSYLGTELGKRIQLVN